MTQQEREELLVTIAMLRGATIMRPYLGRFDRPDLKKWWCVQTEAGGILWRRSREEVAEAWLRDIGIHVSPDGQIIDLSTRVEDTSEGNDGVHAAP